MIKVINIITGVSVAQYADTPLGEVTGKKMAEILNSQIPKDSGDSSFDKLYVAVNTGSMDETVSP